MTPYKSRKAPKGDMVCLLTSEGIGRKYNIYNADFRDMKALYYPPANCYVGADQSGQMRMCKNPVMVNGIWFGTIDQAMEDKYRDTPAVDLTLEIIS